MRKSLIGYYPPTESELKDLWQTGLIVLDANVLLNLYRYSSAAREELLQLLGKLKDRLWIPYQVALEYHRARLGLIREERKSCEDFLKQFDQLVQSLDQTRRHPFVGVPLQSKLKGIVEELRNEIATDSESLDALRRSDPILDQITSMYDGRVGPIPDSTKKDGWLKDGEERYLRGVPPGFEDRKKADERKFGDLFLWMELLDHVRSKKLPVIFVTDDAKKDWWREVGGETVGPHPSLVSEIVAITSRPFHMYRPERFVEFAGKQISQPVSADVVKEVREAQAAAQEAANARRHLTSSDLDAIQRQWELLRRSHGEDLSLRQSLQRFAEEHLRRQQELEHNLQSHRDVEEYLRRQEEMERLMRHDQQLEEHLRWHEGLERQRWTERETAEFLRRREDLERLKRNYRSDGEPPQPPPSTSPKST